MIDGPFGVLEPRIMTWQRSVGGQPDFRVGLGDADRRNGFVVEPSGEPSDRPRPCYRSSDSRG